MKLKNDAFRLIPSTAKPNDLAFFAGVLAEINNVVSATYGPEAGYVAQQDKINNTGFNYSKDGLTTLNHLKFATVPEMLVLQMVVKLAFKIKETSGDGSTTAAKLLYYMIRVAMEELKKYKKEDKEKLFRKHRVTTPKAMEIIIRKFEEIVNALSEASKPDYETLRQAAYIALNSDDELIKPIDELISYMKENKAPVDETLMIDAFKSDREKTAIDLTPGYVLGASNFMIDNSLHEINNSKVILMPCILSADMVEFILRYILEYVNELTDPVKTSEDKLLKNKLVFIVAGMDIETTLYLKEFLKLLQSNNTEMMVDFIEFPKTSLANTARIEDLSYLINADVLDIHRYITKRDMVDPRSPFDKDETKGLAKWNYLDKPYVDALGKEYPDKFVRDWYYGFNEFKKALNAILDKTFETNIKLSTNVGLTVSLSKDGLEKSKKNEAYKNTLKNHIRNLEASTKADNVEMADLAHTRLYYLKSNMYIIHVAKRVGDVERIYTAYKDATKAMTSVAKHGFHLGGSVGLYQIIKVVDFHLNGEIKDETVVFLLGVIKEAIIHVIQDLKLDFNDMDIEEILDGHVTLSNLTIDNVKVIVPIETDKVMLPNVLYLFSSMFSSLLVGFESPVDAVDYMTASIRVNKSVDDAIAYMEGKDKKEEPTEHKEEIIDTDVDGGFLDDKAREESDSIKKEEYFDVELKDDDDYEFEEDQLDGDEFEEDEDEDENVEEEYEDTLEYPSDDISHEEEESFFRQEDPEDFFEPEMEEYGEDPEEEEFDDPEFKETTSIPIPEDMYDYDDEEVHVEVTREVEPEKEEPKPVKKTYEKVDDISKVNIPLNEEVDLGHPAIAHFPPSVQMRFIMEREEKIANEKAKLETVLRTDMPVILDNDKTVKKTIEYRNGVPVEVILVEGKR